MEPMRREHGGRRVRFYSCTSFWKTVGSNNLVVRMDLLDDEEGLAKELNALGTEGWEFASVMSYAGTRRHPRSRNHNEEAGAVEHAARAKKRHTRATHARKQRQFRDTVASPRSPPSRLS